MIYQFVSWVYNQYIRTGIRFSQIKTYEPIFAQNYDHHWPEKLLPASYPAVKSDIPSYLFLYHSLLPLYTPAVVTHLSVLSTFVQLSALRERSPIYGLCKCISQTSQNARPRKTDSQATLFQSLCRVRLFVVTDYTESGSSLSKTTQSQTLHCQRIQRVRFLVVQDYADLRPFVVKDYAGLGFLLSKTTQSQVPRCQRLCRVRLTCVYDYAESGSSVYKTMQSQASLFRVRLLCV